MGMEVMEINLRKMSCIVFDPEMFRELKKEIPCLRKLSEGRFILQGKRRSKMIEAGDYIVFDRFKENFFVIEKDLVEIFKEDEG